MRMVKLYELIIKTHMFLRNKILPYYYGFMPFQILSNFSLNILSISYKCERYFSSNVRLTVWSDNKAIRVSGKYFANEKETSMDSCLFN